MKRLLSFILLVLSLLPAGVSLHAQEEKPADSRPVPNALDDEKVPETAAEAEAEQKRIETKLAEIPADTVDKKDLRAAYDTQVQQLKQLVRELGLMETFDQRLKTLQDETGKLREELTGMGEPVVVPKIAEDLVAIFESRGNEFDEIRKKLRGIDFEEIRKKLAEIDSDGQAVKGRLKRKLEAIDTAVRSKLVESDQRLKEADTLKTQKEKDQQELAGQITGIGKTLDEKTAALAEAEQALREAQQKGEDVLLREQQVYARKLEREVLRQRKAVLEKQQAAGRRRLEVDKAAAELALARRMVSSQTSLRDAITSSLAELQTSDRELLSSLRAQGRGILDPEAQKRWDKEVDDWKKTLDERKRLARAEQRRVDPHTIPLPTEPAGDQGPWFYFYGAEVQRILAEMETAALRREEVERNSRLVEGGTHANLLELSLRLRREIELAESGDDDGAFASSADRIRDRRTEAAGRVERARENAQFLKDALDAIRKKPVAAEVAKREWLENIKQARESGTASESDPLDRRPTEKAWTELESSLRKAFDDEIIVLNQQIKQIEQARADWSELRRIADTNYRYLEDRLRWTREESHIDLASLKMAAEHARDGIANAPSHLVAGFEVVKDYLVSKERRTRLIVVGVVFIALGFLLWRLRRRLPKTYVWIEEQVKDGNQFIKVLGIYLRRTDLSLLIAVLLVGAPLAADVDSKILWSSVCLFATPFLYRLGRATLDIFFQPGSNEVRFFDMDEKLAEIVHRAGRYLLNLALVFVPAGFLMELWGYDYQTVGDTPVAKNPGFVEFWWLVYNSLTQLVLLFSIFRPIVVRTLIRGQNIVAVSLKAWILLGYPLVVGGTLFIFVLGALGYQSAQDFFQIIILKSLAVLLIAYLGYRFILRAVLRGREVDKRLNPDEFESDVAYVAAGRSQYLDKLLRTIIRFGFAIPVYLLLTSFWGELSYDWASGGLFGSEGLSLVDLLEAAFVVFVTAVIVMKVRGALTFLILPNTKLDRGLRYTVVMLTTYGMWTIGMVVTLQLLRVRGEHIAFFTGALAFGIGFGLQSIVKNFVSGLILLVERPVKVGDMVEVENRAGSVDKITLRATTVMTWDGIGVVIPNELMIGGSLTNYSLGHPRLRSTLAVGVAYGSDIQKVRKILNEVVANHGLILKRPEPEAFFVGFGDSSLDFNVMFWTNITTHRPRTLSDLRFAIDAAFRREGVEIPFPQRDLHVRTVAGTVVGAFGGAKLPKPGDGGALDVGPAAPQGGSAEKSSS